MCACISYMDHAHWTGAQIIDLMLLVVDVTKGIQTQTAEVSTWLSIGLGACKF